MVHPQQNYRTLLAQAKQLLTQQHKQEEWLLTDQETCDFFRQRAAQTSAARPRQQPPAAGVPPRQTAKPTPPPQQPRPVVAAPPPIKTPLPEPENVSKIPERKTLLSAPTTTHTADDLKEWKEIVQKIAPKLTLLDGPPSAQEAFSGNLQQASVWIIIPAQVSPAERKFLNDLAHALTLQGRMACVIPSNVLGKPTHTPKQVLSVHNAAPESLQSISTPLTDVSSLLDNADAKAQLWKRIEELA